MPVPPTPLQVRASWQLHRQSKRRHGVAESSRTGAVCVAQVPYSRRDRELIDFDPHLAERFRHLTRLTSQVRREPSRGVSGRWCMDGCESHRRVGLWTPPTLPIPLDPSRSACSNFWRSSLRVHLLANRWRLCNSSSSERHGGRLPRRHNGPASGRRWTRCSTRCGACTNG